jgi:hypothetical protein
MTMTLAPTASPLAELVADLLRRTADAISPPHAPVIEKRPSPAPAYDPDKDRLALSAAFRDRLPAHIRRDLGIDV